MKKTGCMALIVAMVIVGCHTTRTAKQSTPQDQLVDLSHYSGNGLDLIASNDCLTCHKVEGKEKLVGPSYKQIALRYKPYTVIIDKLAAKIITGGSGSWSNLVMVPHPKLNQKDAKEMVQYILSLR